MNSLDIKNIPYLNDLTMKLGESECSELHASHILSEKLIKLTGRYTNAIATGLKN
jgi:hypothetical protein